MTVQSARPGNTLARPGTLAPSRPQRSERQRFLRVVFGRRVMVVSVAIILTLILVAILAPVIAPYDPYQQNLRAALQPPSLAHPAGTDALGRDALSRIIYGARTSLAVGLISVTIGGVIGTVLGLMAGYFGGWLNTLIMRTVDAQLALPPLILTLAIGAALGGGLQSIIISLGIALIPTYARVTAGQVLTVTHTEYVTACRVVGCGNLRTMLLHIFPNCVSPLIVLVSLNLGVAILAEAGLSFLGLGITPPGAAWGSMVNDGQRYLATQPWLSIAPGACIVLVVLAFNLVGDGLRDALDPRIRGTR